MRRGRLRRRYGRQAWWEWKPSVIDERLQREKAKTRPIPRMTMREMVEHDRRAEEERRHTR